MIRVLQLPGFYYNNIHSKSLLQFLFHPQQLGFRHDNSTFVGRLKVTILQVSNKNTSYILRLIITSGVSNLQFYVIDNITL